MYTDLLYVPGLGSGETIRQIFNMRSRALLAGCRVLFIALISEDYINFTERGIIELTMKFLLDV